VGITIYIRYRQIEQIYEEHSDLHPTGVKCNKVALWLGFVSCLGVSVVANFQETNVRIVHFSGGISLKKLI